MGRRHRSARPPGLARRARFARRVPVVRRRARTRRPFARREGAARAHPLTARAGLLGRAARRRPARTRARSSSVPGLWGSRGTIKPRRTVGPRSAIGSRNAIGSRSAIGSRRAVSPRSAVGPRGTGRSRGLGPHVARNVDQTTRRIDGRRIQHLLPPRAHAAAARSLTGAGTRRIGPGLLAAPRMGYFWPVPVAGAPAATRTRRPPDPDEGQNQQGNQANRDAHPAQGQAQAG
jgi:hypothetical protein